MEPAAEGRYRVTIEGQEDEAEHYFTVATPRIEFDDPGLRRELLKKIRQTDQNLPGGFLSAFGDRATYAKATELGVVDFVTKPFRAGSLLGLIQRTLGSQSTK